MRATFAALVLVAGLLASTATGSSDVLTVTRDDGQRLWSLPVWPGDQVVLAYTNSIYLAATEERLTLTAGGFDLTEVRSTSEAVLYYNGLEGPFSRQGAFYSASVSRHLAELVLRIGRTGRQRLMVASRELPLYTAGEGTRLRVQVTGR